MWFVKNLCFFAQLRPALILFFWPNSAPNLPKLCFNFVFWIEHQSFFEFCPSFAPALSKLLLLFMVFNWAVQKSLGSLPQPAPTIIGIASFAFLPFPWQPELLFRFKRRGGGFSVITVDVGWWIRGCLMSRCARCGPRGIFAEPGLRWTTRCARRHIGRRRSMAASNWVRGRRAALQLRSQVRRWRNSDYSGVATIYVKVVDPAVQLLTVRMLNEHRSGYAVQSSKHPHSFRVELVWLDDASMEEFCKVVTSAISRAQKQLSFKIKSPGRWFEMFSKWCKMCIFSGTKKNLNQ